MALTASYPLLIEDLAMKFNKHSLQESIQLPMFYRPKWQAKEFALYLQPIVNLSIDQDRVSPFEFKANGTVTTKKSNRCSRAQSDRLGSAKHSPRHSPKREPVKQANNAKTIQSPVCHTGDSNKEVKSRVVKNLQFTDEECMSEDEELSCYFSQEATGRVQCQQPRVSAIDPRNHNRKRSMENDECNTLIKRCCRPRLNFDKMLLNSRDSLEIGTWSNAEIDLTASSYFRPISPEKSGLS